MGRSFLLLFCVRRTPFTLKENSLIKYSVMSQVFVVVAAGSVLSFIIRELGEPAIASWVIQGPLLMQSVLSPPVGRLSDVLDRKLFATIPPLIACIGAIVIETPVILHHRSAHSQLGVKSTTAARCQENVRRASNISTYYPWTK